MVSIFVPTWGTPNQRNPPSYSCMAGWITVTSWNTVGTLLAAQGYHCMALDHRGHGHSAHIPRYEEYHFPDYISDLQAFIEAHLLTDFVLIGHSMGGTIASIYSALCPFKPTQCILIDGLGPKHETEAEATHRFKLHLSQRSRQSKHRPMTLETTIKKLSRAHTFLSEHSLRQQALRLTDEIDSTEMREWRWDPDIGTNPLFSLPRFLDILSQIEIPTHCIFGKNSWYLQPPGYPISPESHSPIANSDTVTLWTFSACRVSRFVGRSDSRVFRQRLY